MSGSAQITGSDYGYFRRAYLGAEQFAELQKSY
jgi:hypothetical protein